MNYNDKFLSQLNKCLVSDARFLKKQLDRTSNKSGDNGLKILKKIERSIDAVEARKQRFPVCRYPEELPVSERRNEISLAIKNNQVVVVAGETGSGKTTQIPKICLELGLGARGFIGHTQPRRIAARTVASRIAEELGCELGNEVGYKVRFGDHVNDNSLIKLMTDGIILSEIQSDRDLSKYECLIIDEAHERSLNIDFLLGYIKKILPRRPDLKIIITSATIDTDRFSKHFNSAPVVLVSGRSYPVEIQYRPFPDDENSEYDQVNGIVDTVKEISKIDRGDILVFLSGEREIRETAEELNKHQSLHSDIIPLYSRQSASEQNKIFSKSGVRRIILSTNVAETSLTVPGIKYVIDTGLARISRYSFRSKVQRLPIEKISQASARQRSGRCGRTEPGVCFRLYSEDDFLSRRDFTEPEILRTNLASVILQMLNLGLGDIEKFPFVETPDRRLISDGYRLLFELGAIEENKHLTTIGREMVKYPLDPRYSRMLISARKQNCLNDMVVLVSALSIQDPRERPLDKQNKADEVHKQFSDRDSDFVSLIKLWRFYEERRLHSSETKLRKLCKQMFLSYSRMREWHELQRQIITQLKSLGIKLSSAESDYDSLHKSIVSGLLGNIAVKGDEHYFLGTRNSKFNIFPGSSLFKSQPKWIVAAEIVETSRLYARTVAVIKPQWIDELSQHLVKKHFYQPHWQKKQGRVVAYEQVTLYGLIIISKRRVDYGKINPVEAREIFIRSGLVEDLIDSNAEFITHNHELVCDVADLENRLRRRDVLVDSDALYQFYDVRIPENIHNFRDFEIWRKDVEKNNPRHLFFTREAVVNYDADISTKEMYPDDIVIHGYRYELKYEFIPGEDHDGINMVVPLSMLNQLRNEDLDCLVPGFIGEKIEFLLRSLPKAIRKQLPSVPQVLKDICPLPDTGDVLRFIQNRLDENYGVIVVALNWKVESLPDHLRINIVVTDNDKQIASGRDLLELQSGLGQRAKEQFCTDVETDLPKGEIYTWNFEALPSEIFVEKAGQNVSGFPALVDYTDYAKIELFDTKEQAVIEHSHGIARLLSFSLKEKIRYLNKNHPLNATTCLYYHELASCNELRADFLYLLLNNIVSSKDDVRNEAEFHQLETYAQREFVPSATRLGVLITEILTLYYQINQQKSQLTSTAMKSSYDDIQSQVDWLIYPGFIWDTPYCWLEHYPRFLNAINHRLKKLQGGIERDEALMSRIQNLWLPFTRLSEEVLSCDAADELRWLIEELRVSLFAQHLGTSCSVSEKKLFGMLSALRN